MIRVGFLILDDIHHLHHLAPVAFEFSRRPEYECVVFIQSASNEIVKKIAKLFPGQRCRIQILAAPLFTRLKYKLRQQTLRSERVMRCHASMLLDFDALISADRDMHALIAKSRHLPKRPVFFTTSHGAGDRDRKLAENSLQKNFDFVLLHGHKYRELFNAVGYLNPGNHAVVGYPKFDIVPLHHRPRLFADDKPVIVYNPHFAQEVSSWPTWGLAVLEYFYVQKKYNFIFAPHRNLFNRCLKPRILPKKYFNASHMIMDLGSEKSVDMTYTQAADIYLGDVSSQVYEFIRRPRPCLFLNPRGITWQNDPHYRCWQLGAVIHSLPELWARLAIDDWRSNPYMDVQRDLFNHTFSIESEPAARRAAVAIHQQLQGSSGS